MKYETYTLENNPIAYRIIKNAFNSGKLSHSYLFSAQKNYLIESEVLFLIQKLISKDGVREPLSYPDLTVIDGSKGLISKDAVIQATEKLQQTALDSLGVKVLWIKNVENGNSQSLNSLLKFIEEPTKNTFIVMTTNALPQVLSTIRSRSQNISLKSNTFDSLVNSLQIKGVSTQKAKLIASIANSSDQAISLISSSDFEELSTSLVKSLSLIIDNKQKTHSELAQILKKDNFKTALGLLASFFNDVWKVTETMPLTFEQEKELAQAYLSKKFDYEKALFLISDFLIKMNYNVNFDLYKNKFLVELEECYA